MENTNETTVEMDNECMHMVTSPHTHIWEKYENEAEWRWIMNARVWSPQTPKPIALYIENANEAESPFPQALTPNIWKMQKKVCLVVSSSI